MKLTLTDAELREAVALWAKQETKRKFDPDSVVFSREEFEDGIVNYSAEIHRFQ